MNIEQRLTKIVVESDIAKQSSSAETYIKTLRRKSKKLNTLAAKLAMLDQIKVAEQTLHKLRLLAFDIEDALRENKPALSVLK